MKMKWMSVMMAVSLAEGLLTGCTAGKAAGGSADAGVNYIRVRVWNDPYDAPRVCRMAVRPGLSATRPIFYSLFCWQGIQSFHEGKGVIKSKENISIFTGGVRSIFIFSWYAFGL